MEHSSHPKRGRKVNFILGLAHADNDYIIPHVYGEAIYLFK